MSDPVTRKPFNAPKASDAATKPLDASEVVTAITGAVEAPKPAPVVTGKQEDPTRGDPNATIDPEPALPTVAEILATDKAAADLAKREELAAQATVANTDAEKRSAGLHDRALDKAAAEMKDAPNDRFTFLAKHPALTIYVQADEYAIGRDGIKVPTESRIDFVNGVVTVGPAKADALRGHKRFNNMFRETTDNTLAAAQRKALAQRRAQMQVGVVTGTTSSDAANEQRYLTEENNLNAAEDQLSAQKFTDH